MSRKKKERQKGKLSLSRYFQKLEVGERVAVVRELSEERGFPDRIHGLTGVIKSKKGKAYIVELRDKNQTKEYIIKPIHLKKLDKK